jgi:tetratricopeptide (TPR) repeat protein
MLIQFCIKFSYINKLFNKNIKGLTKDSFKPIYMQKKLAILLLLTVFSLRVSAQSEKDYVTDKVCDKYAYVDVIKTYERVAAKGYKSVDLFQKLGNSSYSNYKLDKAAAWYGELFAMTSDLDPIYYYRYAESLRFICQNEKADALIEKLKHRPKSLVKSKV